MKKWVLRFILVISSIFVLAVVILVVVAMLPFLIPYPKVTFLNALLTGDEHTAQQYLSPELQSAVEAQCPNGQITACATNLISPAWGDFETVTFIFGSASPSAELFYASYSERWEPIAIVLVHDPEDKNIITGWRGFVTVEDEDAASEVLRGRRLDNQFP